MNPIDISVRRPVLVIVGILLLVIFGLVSFFQLPYQLTPKVTQPKISVKTFWAGATPYEVEREIIEKQEEELKSTPELVRYESNSKDNMGEITLTFKIGTDMSRAMLEVSNKLNQVDNYPENVDKPVISSSGATASPVIWLGFVTDKGNKRSIDTYKTFIEEKVKEHYERIEGVAGIFQAGGTDTQMHIYLYPERLAAYGLTIDQVMTILQQENRNISAGSVDIDRRTYRVRTTAEFLDEQSLRDTVIFNDGEHEIKLSDIADVNIGYEKDNVTILTYDNDEISKTLAFGIQPEADANIVDMTNLVEEKTKWIQENLLNKEHIHIKWFSDQRQYILGSIDLVKQNIIIGGTLAMIVLLLFLRSITATAVVGIAIPISIIATFIVLFKMDSTLNTISLAGISFAVGMLLDSAIVVLENIDRHHRMGKRFFKAAHDGATEVWGALVASSLTTIAVFTPVLLMDNEAGQLFKDIAIAVTGAIFFSLFVSISVIPMLWTQIMRINPKNHAQDEQNSEVAHNSLLVNFGSFISKFFMRIVEWSLNNKLNQLIIIVLMTIFSIITILVLFPKMEYLPQGNRNFIMNIFVPPPGLSNKEKSDIGHEYFKKLIPHYHKELDGLPGIKEMFYVASGPFIVSGVIATDEQRAREFIPMLTPLVNSFPGVIGLSLQEGVFERGIGEGRSIDVDISGERVEDITNAGGILFGAIMQAIPGAQIRPVPSVELLFPEVRLIPERGKLKKVGMDSTSFGIAADVLMDGRKISEFKADGEKAIDMILKTYGKDNLTPEELYYTQIATKESGLVSISELSTMQRTTGISEIRHVGGTRTITLQVTPPMTMTLEEAMEQLKSGVIDKMVGNPTLNGSDIKLTGQADKLTETVEMMKWNLLLAILIIYLLMSALFSNFVYPLVILFTVPLATAGGFLGLSLTDTFIARQPLDVLTMMGFIILIGIVVNNAILIVYQALNNVRLHMMDYKEAIIESTRTRLRPIFMSSLTSVFGMLPLVLMPGPGSEFYRGLGSVITGGLALSTVFTILVTPALLFFVIKIETLHTKKVNR